MDTKIVIYEGDEEHKVLDSTWDNVDEYFQSPIKNETIRLDDGSVAKVNQVFHDYQEGVIYYFVHVIGYASSGIDGSDMVEFFEHKSSDLFM